MVRPHPDHIVVIGAGAAGLMAARMQEAANAEPIVIHVDFQARCRVSDG
jgi:predicted flavoprotein YhiN